jgi:shikimate kinase
LTGEQEIAHRSGKEEFYCPNHILLIGFMGSGKSTAARKLARMYGKVSFDTDIGITRMTGKTIPQIFDEEGEAGFREHEYEYLKYLMGVDSAIVSCGGGIISTKKCRDLLRMLGFVVFMKVDPDEAVSRISSPESRPLLKDRQQMRELLEKRMPLYLETCDMTFDTTGLQPAQVARQLGGILQERGLM